MSGRSGPGGSNSQYPDGFAQVLPYAKENLLKDADVRCRNAVRATAVFWPLVICAGLIIGLYCALEVSGILPAWHRIRELRIRVLCRTDYKALLDACRELSQRADKGELKHKQYFVYAPTPEVSAFPRAILDLEPSTVTIDATGRVMIAIVGGLGGHFGVLAYPEGFEASYPHFICGDRKLIDGLWYYDEKYNENPGYDKKVDAWIKKYGRGKPGGGIPGTPY